MDSKFIFVDDYLHELHQCRMKPQFFRRLLSANLAYSRVATLQKLP
jgi:hypothetical protein